MFSILYTPRALANFKKTPHQWQKRIARMIDPLATNPYAGKRLQGNLAGQFSLRVWPYRVIYIIKKQEIIVVILDVRHRQNAYK